MAVIAKVRSGYEGSTIINDAPLVAYIDNFLSAEECAHIISLAAGNVQRARVSLEGDAGITLNRTNSNTWLHHDTDETVKSVADRIAEIVGIPLENAESLQVIHYGVNEEYKAHMDSYNLSTERGRRFCSRGGQRLVTALVYLNDIDEGGATYFPTLRKEITAKTGRLALFHNCHPQSTRPHKGSLHAGTPVIEGEKWAFNLWFHARPMHELQDFSEPDIHVFGKATAKIRKPASGPGQLITNRVTGHFKKAADRVKDDLGPERCKILFTYWDTYGNNPLILPAMPKHSRIYQLIDRSILNRLSDKKSLAAMIRDAGLRDVAPVTYASKQEALAHTAPMVDMWFVKVAHGTGGKGMHCVKHADLADHEVGANHILQAAISNIMLIEGKKFTTRIYALIWNKKLFLYRNGFNITHGTAFDPNSTDYGVQIDHSGYRDKNSGIEMIPLDRYEHYDRYYPRFAELLRKLEPVLHDAITASDEGRYVLLGIDVMLQEDAGVQLVEINTIPNFQHTHEINETVNIPFFEAAMRMMFGLPSETLDRIL